MIVRQYLVKNYRACAKSWPIAMYCVVKLAMNAICWRTKSIWHEMLTYLTQIYLVLSIKNVNWQHRNFHKYNFRNDHVLTKITKIFYCTMKIWSYTVASKVLADIFGNKEGPTFFVDSKIQKMNLIPSWVCLRKGGRDLNVLGANYHMVRSIFSWFKKYHTEKVKSTMLCPIRIAAGLGDPP